MPLAKENEEFAAAGRLVREFGGFLADRHIAFCGGSGKEALWGVRASVIVFHDGVAAAGLRKTPILAYFERDRVQLIAPAGCDKLP